MKNIFLLCFLLLNAICYFSCRSSENSEKFPIVIDANPDKAILHLPLSSIFDEITYIPLETRSPEVLFGLDWLGTVIMQDDKIIIFDNPSVEENVFIFDNKGKFRNKITAKGEGPGKILATNDILYDSKKEHIEILDYYQKKIIQYDLEGNLKEEIPTLHSFYKFVKFDNDSYCFYSRNRPQTEEEEPKNLWRVNKDKIESFLPIPKYIRKYNIEEQNFSNNYKGSYLFKNILSREFYRISSTVPPYAEYQIDFGNKWVKEDVLDRLALDIRKYRKKLLYAKKDHVYQIKKVFETENYIFFTYYYDSCYFWNFYNKKTNINVISKTRQNDIDQGLLGEQPRVRAWTVYDDCLVFLAAANDIRFRAESLKLPAESPLSQVAAKLGWEDNPVVIIAKLRKDIGQ